MANFSLPAPGLSQFVLPLAEKQRVRALVIGLLDQYLRLPAQVPVLRRGRVGPFLAGGDAVLFEHDQEQLGVHLRACVKQLHLAGMGAAGAKPFPRNVVY